MINIYVKKPIKIEAVKWDGSPESYNEICSLSKERKVYLHPGSPNIMPKLVILTLEGEMEASCGDFIIRGVKGEIYPCKPDIFEMTYQPFYQPKDLRGNDFCNCSHIRKNHGPTRSINYTEGRCSECECQNFSMAGVV